MMVNSRHDADEIASEKADTASAFARNLADWERELDACMRAVYGCSLAEFCEKAVAYGREWGQREGRTAGRRSAKGLKTPPRKRGRPSEIDEGERTLLIHGVETRKPDHTIKEAVTYFLHAMQAGERIAQHSLKASVSRALQEGKRIDPQVIVSSRQPPRGPITLTVVNKAVRAYYRHRPRKRPS
jgi:hypothetical protein